MNQRERDADLRWKVQHKANEQRDEIINVIVFILCVIDFIFWVRLGDSLAHGVNYCLGFGLPVGLGLSLWAIVVIGDMLKGGN
jgi:hypothetical protein